MNFFYSNTFPHISSEDTTRELVRLGQRGPGVTETQTSTLAKGHKISLPFGGWEAGVAFYAFTRLPKCTRHVTVG